MYPGDLFNAVLRAERTYWHANVEQWQAVFDIADSLVRGYQDLRDPFAAFKSSTFAWSRFPTAR